VDLEGRNSVSRFVLEVADAAFAVPRAIGFTAVGAGVVIGRVVLRIVSSMLPSSKPVTRHHAGRVREGAAAAGKAARASGLLSKRKRNRAS
jgi:hypothetical protein